MKVVSIRELSSSVPQAVRDAADEPVLVSKHNHPAAIIVGADKLRHAVKQIRGDDDVYRATLQVLAVDLFSRGVLSMGRAAELAGLRVPEFIDLCARLEIPVLQEPESGLDAEVGAFEKWLASAGKSD